MTSIVQIADIDRRNPDDLRRIYVRGARRRRWCRCRT